MHDTPATPSNQNTENQKARYIRQILREYYEYG